MSVWFDLEVLIYNCVQTNFCGLKTIIVLEKSLKKVVNAQSI